MSRNKEELCLGSRYIHTGNSGISFFIVRDLKRVDRAEVLIENGAFGAFSTRMTSSGNDYEGFTAVQLRDLALMFLNAAEQLDKGTDAAFEPNSPSLCSKEGSWRSVGNMPSVLEASLVDTCFKEDEFDVDEFDVEFEGDAPLRASGRSRARLVASAEATLKRAKKKRSREEVKEALNKKRLLHKSLLASQLDALTSRYLGEVEAEIAASK